MSELAHYGKSEKSDIEFLEVLIAMVLLARVKYERKLRCEALSNYRHLHDL